MKSTLSLMVLFVLSVSPCLAQLRSPIRPVLDNVADQTILPDHSSPRTNKIEEKLPPQERTNFQKKMENDHRFSMHRYSLVHVTSPETNADFAALSPTDLVAYLESVDNSGQWQSILFNFEADESPNIFTNEKIQAVALSLKNHAPSFSGNFSSGIYGLLGYLHVAIYFDFFYQDKVAVVPNSWDVIRQATDLLCANPHLLDLNAEASAIVDEFLIVLDSPGVRSSPATLSFVTSVMRAMVVSRTWKTVVDIHLVDGYWRIFYIMFRGAEDADYLEAIAHDDDYLSLWATIAVDSEIRNNPDLHGVWQDNAVAELCRVAGNLLLQDKICPALKNVSEVFPRLSKNWLNAVVALIDAGVASHYNIFENKDQLKNEVTDKLFPNTYSYDDGKLVFKAKFIRDVAGNLYYASKQTQAQFFRLIQTDQFVPGDVNENLTAFVFESKDVYDDYAPFLFGISTNNGGMYMEGPAEFYTWDRPSSYGLSLEELFRHEYNHYLQGRFLIPGYWGETPLYEDNRLVWFEEGQAEFLCGSTDFEGIKLRERTISRVQNDSPNWPTLAEVLSSSYNDPNAIYYPYGNLLWYDWYQNDYAKIKTVSDLTRNNDVEGFDRFVNALKTDPAAETQWESFLADVDNGAVQGWKPATNWKNDRYLTVASLTDLQNEFSALTGVTSVSTEGAASSLIRRFKILGTLEGAGQATSNTEAASSVNQALDTLLVRLKNDPLINNFDYTVGYITDVTYQGNLAQAHFCINGSLRNAGVSDDPISDFVTDRNIALTGDTIHLKSTSTGYIKSYLWSFPNGIPTTSTAVNPTVSYALPGTYDITLTTAISSNSSVVNTKTIHDCLKVYSPPTVTYGAASNAYDYSWISEVKVGDIDNTSDGFPLSGYSDFTSQSITELISGTSYPISVDLSYVNSPDITIAVWIDLNQNGSFDDPGEQLLLAHPMQNTQLTDASILIPPTSLPGVTRMRIRSSYGGTPISPTGVDDYMGETEDYSVVVTTPKPVVTYRIPSNGYDYSWISQVKIGDINNVTTGFPPNGYSDFTSSSSTSLKQAESYPIDIELSFVNSPSMTISAWIDLNQNGSFDDPGEQLLLAYPSQNSQLTGAAITIPAAALVGTTRMRIRSSYDGEPISSSDPDDYMGETEDYTVEIVRP